MNQSFHNYKTKQQNKLTNISNLYSFDNNLKNNFISFSNLLELNLKGLKINNYNYKYNTLNYIQYIDYKYNSINNKFIKKIYDFLFYSFLSMNSLISKPIFENFNDKLVIHLFFYLHKKSNKNNNFISLNNIKL